MRVVGIVNDRSSEAFNGEPPIVDDHFEVGGIRRHKRGNVHGRELFPLWHPSSVMVVCIGPSLTLDAGCMAPCQPSVQMLGMTSLDCRVR